jgi:DNA repair protein RecN (Recombination protein N)
MLKELSIKNLAVIESVRVLFEPGLNVLTGETGAGKSILIDALTLLLGHRATTDVIRTGADSATVEAIFSLPRSDALVRRLAELGFPLEQEELILRRELSRAGRNRAYLNDSPATLAVMAEVGEALVEIHGQHETQALLRAARHTDLLDDFSDLLAERHSVAAGHEEWFACTKELEELRAAARERAQRQDLYQFQVREIDAAALHPGEEEALREERRRLQHAERLTEGTAQAYALLAGENSSALGQGERAQGLLREMAKLDPGLDRIVQDLEATLIPLDDVTQSLRAYRGKIEVDPGRLEELDRRLDELTRLKRKYGDTVEAILTLRNEAARALEAIGEGEERAEALERRLEALVPELTAAALTLSRRRKEAARKLESLIAREIHELGMAKARFQVQLSQEPAVPDAPSANGSRVTARGVDLVEFLIAPNPGEEPRPLARIASGGELSRIMLALKVVLAATDQVPVVIFDEVDAGIGGRTADTIGRKLHQVARGRQVISVTHLPQIACYADHHLQVEKRIRAGRTAVGVVPLSGQERIQEIARMLGGESVTEASLRHAKELLRAARP